MQFNRKFLIISIVVVVLGLTVWKVAANNGWLKTDSESVAVEGDDRLDQAHKNLNKKIGGKETPITVSAEAVTKGDLIKTVSAQGRVHSYEQTTLTAEVGGRLVELYVRDGDKVKEGQVLGRIDDRDYKLAYSEARAKHLAAQADLVASDQTRTDFEVTAYKPQESITALEKQFKQGLISADKYHAQKQKLELEEVRSGSRRSEVLAAKYTANTEVAMERARLNLEKCAIIAPFSGQIFELAVSKGALVGTNTEIAKLVNTSDLVVKASVIESEIGKISLNRDTSIRITALPDMSNANGKVLAISPLVNTDNKTVETIVRINSKDSRIRNGMFAEVKIDAAIFKDRMMVPKQAILVRDNRKVVFKISEESRAKWIYVKTGEENDDFVEIIGGEIAPGEMVLTDNHYTMGHDTLVKIGKKK